MQPQNKFKDDEVKNKKENNDDGTGMPLKPNMGHSFFSKKYAF